MDETLLKRLVGVVALILAAMLLTSILPKPGPAGLDGTIERIVTMDLSRPDSLPVEVEQGAASAPLPMETEIPPPTPLVAEPENSTPATTDPADSTIESAPQAAPPPAVVTPDSAPAASPANKPAEAPSAQAVVAPPQEAPKPAAAPTSADGKWQVQAGAYAQLDRAESVRAKAASVRVSCVISPADTAQGTLYRVRCGPYATRDQGQTAVQLLAGTGIKAQVVGAGR